MDLITPNGEKLVRSQEEIQDILRELAPKNKEQERILAQAIGKQIEKNRKDKMNKGLKVGFGNTFQRNTKLRKGDTRSPSKDWQLIAAVPKEMAYVARQVWGDDVFTNPSKFKEAFVKDELGQLCLTVDPRSI